ncbi:hypothetical protein [Paenibacillus sp. Marseille-Q4541]|uniref:hypothetical protein n=1 Tax=Paenibacillus sp. Marseille-Q4541 TaxID=2831522 RepID=UPI001BAD3835|nr:hypothetical protein [Paenibacillus sp. Marseille-Q4541]
MNTLKLIYFNQQWNPYFLLDEPKEKVYPGKLDNTFKFGDGDFLYSFSELGLCDFGFRAHKEKDKPGHGGLWSSNSGTLTFVLKKSMKEVSVKTTEEVGFVRLAISVETLKNILPSEGYTIVNHPFSDGMEYWNIHHEDDDNLDLSGYGYYGGPTREFEFETAMLQNWPKATDSTESPSEAAAV